MAALLLGKFLFARLLVMHDVVNAIDWVPFEMKVVLSLLMDFVVYLFFTLIELFKVEIFQVLINL